MWCRAALRSLHRPSPPLLLRQRRLTQTEAKKVTTVSVEDKVQEILDAPPSKLPNSFSRIYAAFKLKFGRDGIDPKLKVLLDASSSQLYFNCADNYDYARLCTAFALPDYFSTWFKLTLLHTWMLLLRLHVSLEADAYHRLQRSLLSALWMDVDKRLEIIGEEHSTVLNSAKDMKKMHGLHLQSFFEYDEGFLADDSRLAGALWRCLYIERDFDPVAVSNAIEYVRSTVAWLDTLDHIDILTEGISEWKQLTPATKSL